MREAWDNVLEFNERFGVPIGGVPKAPDDKRIRARLAKIAEETAELCAAMDSDDLPAIAHELADTIYVLVGTAVEYGIPLVDVWAEVHAANMRKERGKDGEISKPDGWREPDVAGVLKDAGWRP